MARKELPEWSTVVGAKVLIRSSNYLTFSLTEGVITRVTKASVFVKAENRTTERRFVAMNWGDNLEEYGTGSYRHGTYLENGTGPDADWMRAVVRMDLAKAKARRLAQAWTGNTADTSELRQALSAFEIASALRDEAERNREAYHATKK